MSQLDKNNINIPNNNSNRRQNSTKKMSIKLKELINTKR